MIPNFTDEEMDTIEQKFSSLIRDEMSNKEFWDYVSSWKDPDVLCEDMEQWDIQTKKEAIDTIENGFHRPRPRQIRAQLINIEDIEDNNNNDNNDNDNNITP